MTDEVKLCVFEPDPKQEGKLRCTRGGCNVTMRLIPGIPIDQHQAPCKGGRPRVLKRAANFGKAVAKDITAGCPRRTDNQVEEIITICESNACGLYNPDQGWCEHFTCGCDVRSKARLGEEHCPVGQW